MKGSCIFFHDFRMVQLSLANELPPAAREAGLHSFCAILWKYNLQFFVFENRHFSPNRPPHFSMRGERPRAQHRKFHIKSPTKFNFLFENRHFLSNRPLIFYEMRKAARAARKFSDQMAYQTQLSSLKIGNCRQIAPLIFLWDEKGRARAARKNFNITYFLMDFWIERRAQRENVFNI